MQWVMEGIGAIPSPLFHAFGSDVSRCRNSVLFIFVSPIPIVMVCTASVINSCVASNITHLMFSRSLLQPLTLCWMYSEKCSVELGKSSYLPNWQKLSRKPQSSSRRCVPFESSTDTSHRPPVFKHNQLLCCFNFIGWKRERPKYTCRVTNKTFLIWLAMLVPVVLSLWLPLPGQFAHPALHSSHNALLNLWTYIGSISCLPWPHALSARQPCSSCKTQYELHFCEIIPQIP